MPEYLSPGVYVEETSFRGSRAIEGVSTTTTGFIGPTRYGPVDLENALVTSLGEFERTYGDGQPLEFDDGSGGTIEIPNYMWHAARAFFTEGGQRLYVSRVFLARVADGESIDERARAPISTTASGSPVVWARYPGLAGRMRVRLTLSASQNVLGFDRSGVPYVGSIKPWEVVMIRSANEANPANVPSPLAPNTALADFYLATWDVPTQNWVFVQTDLSPGTTRKLADLKKSDNLEIRIVSLSVTVMPVDASLAPTTWPGLALDPNHETSGLNDSFAGMFGKDPHNREFGRDLPILFDQGTLDGLGLLQLLLTTKTSLAYAIEDLKSSDADRSLDLLLSGGSDGQRPGDLQYEGLADPDSQIKTGLKQFEDIDEIAIVAAPGATYLLETDKNWHDQALGIMQQVIIHCQQMRYRIGVLDAANGQSLNQIRALRAQFDTSYAAIYYPWIRVLDPITRVQVNQPPSGFVCGIYARNDITRAVYKAPANEVVNLAQSFEVLLNKAQQDILNPEGINCFRFFEGRGYRLWGARTMSSDTEWNYVNLRRYFAYLEHSIDKGTQWAVFEPNGPLLWANVRRSVEEFLLNEWQSGALLGDKPEQAFFVKCDRTTMTQQDLDTGRMIALVGVAALRPAEFVIFRIGQWTGDRSA